MTDIIERMIEQKKIAKTEIDKWPEGKRALLVDIKQNREDTNRSQTVSNNNMFNYTF